MITLFNGRDLTGLYTWMADTKYEDPRKVFTVHDGLLHISGDGYGYVATRAMYKNYRLIADFKWGPRTWGNRRNRTKDSGILVHCQPPDGSSGNWMAGFEAQIIEEAAAASLLVVGRQGRRWIEHSPVAYVRVEDRRQGRGLQGRATAFTGNEAASDRRFRCRPDQLVCP